MTESLHNTITRNNHYNPRTFGGVIYLSDYNTDCRKKNNTTGSPIAKRILSDRSFDHKCMKNIENRNRFCNGGI